MTNGRLEKELIAEERMKRILTELPEIFSEFYYSMRASKKSYTTMDAYVNYVKNFMNFITNNNPTNDFYKRVTATDIEQYLISLETREVNGKIVRTGDCIQAVRWSALNTFFDFLVNKKEYLTKNPMEKTDRPSINTEHKVVYLVKDEIQQIMDAIDDMCVDEKITETIAIRDKTILGLFLATGLRAGALININIEDIDFDNNIIKVIEKRQKTRDIPFGEQTKKLLQTWINIRNEKYPDIETTALFVSRNHNRISYDAVLDLVKKYTAAAGITKHITPHKMRSSVATNLAANGTDIQTIKNILGHTQITTTQRYVAVLDEEREKAINTLDQLF